MDIETYWAEDARTLLHDMNLWAAVPCAAIASGAMCCWLYLACGLHLGAVHLQASCYEKHAKVLRRRQAVISAVCAGLDGHSRAGCDFASSGWLCCFRRRLCANPWAGLCLVNVQASGALPCGLSLAGSLDMALCTPKFCLPPSRPRVFVHVLFTMHVVLRLTGVRVLIR